jgi:biopolymer transport protein ExbB/TolQ
MMDTLLGGESLTWMVTLLALIVVWVPFYRGLKLSFQAWSATRRIERSELRSALQRRGYASQQGDRDDVEPLALLLLRILRKSLQAADAEEHPPDMIYDASRQYVMNEYDLYYTRPITMFASLLPPIGFIGTTVGMLILFVSMHQANASLELSALAVALTSSIFALIGFAILEGVKIHLYRRLLLCLREVQSLFEDTEASRGLEDGAKATGGHRAAPVPA